MNIPYIIYIFLCISRKMLDKFLPWKLGSSHRGGLKKFCRSMSYALCNTLQWCVIFSSLNKLCDVLQQHFQYDKYTVQDVMGLWPFPSPSLYHAIIAWVHDQNIKMTGTCFFVHDRIYAIARYMLSTVRMSHRWNSQKRLKLGSCNFHHRVAHD